MQVTALKTKACWLNRLSFSQRKACSGSKLLDLLVQTLFFYACCFTDKTGYYKSKLASFTEDPGYHRLSLCMSFACRTAAKLGPCCQPCFTVTGLLLLPTPLMRYKRFRRHWSRTQKGVLVDLLCSEGPPLKHRFALRISVEAGTCCWSDRYLWALLCSVGDHSGAASGIRKLLRCCYHQHLLGRRVHDWLGFQRFRLLNPSF